MIYFESSSDEYRTDDNEQPPSDIPDFSNCFSNEYQDISSDPS